MNRREALRGVGTLVAAGLAGCVSDDVGGERSPDDAETDTPTPTTEPGQEGTVEEEAIGSGVDTPQPDDDGTPSPTDPGEPGTPSGAPDVSFAVVSRGPGNGANEATVSFDDEVLVEGTIAGNDGCYTAELADAGVTDDALRVLVRAVRKGDGMCTQSLVDIGYEASVDFEGSLPRRVVVEHDSLGEVRTVADVER